MSMGCSTAWEIFRHSKPGAERSQGDCNDRLIALRHIKNCPACLMARVGFLRQEGATRNSFWDFLLPLLAKATGLPPEEIALDTPLGPSGVARIAMQLYKIGNRPPHFCVDRPTVGKLLAGLGLYQEPKAPE